MGARYEAVGSVRGSCGHSHRTREAAERCAALDARRCESVGGYSDRVARRVDDGGPRCPGCGAALVWQGQDIVCEARGYTAGHSATADGHPDYPRFCEIMAEIL